MHRHRVDGVCALTRGGRSLLADHFLPTRRSLSASPPPRLVMGSAIGSRAGCAYGLLCDLPSTSSRALVMSGDRERADEAILSPSWLGFGSRFGFGFGFGFGFVFGLGIGLGLGLG